MFDLEVGALLSIGVPVAKSSSLDFGRTQPWRATLSAAFVDKPDYCCVLSLCALYRTLLWMAGR